MKTRLALAFLVAALTGGAGCYNAGDLGGTPFKCSKTLPECPDGYICDLAHVGKNPDCLSSGNCICVPVSGSSASTMTEETAAPAAAMPPVDQPQVAPAALAAPVEAAPAAVPTPSAAETFGR